MQSQPVGSIYYYSYVHVFRADHFRLDNLGGPFLKKIDPSSLGSHNCLLLFI